jgi:hypothetical protein
MLWNLCLKYLLEQSDIVLQYYFILLPLSPSVLTENYELFTEWHNAFRMPWMKYNFQILNKILHTLYGYMITYLSPSIIWMRYITFKWLIWYNIKWLNLIQVIDIILYYVVKWLLSTIYIALNSFMYDMTQ